MVAIWLDSGVRVCVGDACIALGTRHERAIIARLALSPTQTVPRETLARELWPEASVDAARLNLRQRLHALRNVLGAYVQADRREVHLVGARIVVDPNLPPEAFLAELGFPWVERWRDPRVASDSAPTAICPDTVTAWLDAMIWDGEGSPFPYLGRPQELRRFLAGADPEVWRAAAIYDAVIAGRHAEALDLWTQAPDAWGAPVYGSFALEWSGNAAHGLGDYHTTLAMFLEAGRRYELMGAVHSGWRLRFKVHRVMVDMGSVTAGELGLRQLSGRIGDRLAPGIRRMLDFNLVFAHACAGQISLARAAVARARAAVPEHDVSTAFLEANVSTLALEAGDLIAARAALDRYAELIGTNSDPAAHDLLWVRAADLFGRSGELELAAVAHRLITYETDAAGRRVSAINRQRFMREMNGLLARGGGADWLRASAAARKLDAAEASARVREAVRARP
jgi:hypothetical protein